MILYLAGPAVFRPDAAAVGAALKALCQAHGATGLFPLDNEVEPGPRAASAIYRGNLGMIGRAQALVADISPFRGPHCDPGTAFEIGYARAMGKPVHAYSRRAGDLLSRCADACWDGGWRDRDGLAIEDFGLPENLMIALACTVHDGPEAAIAAAVADVVEVTRR